MDEINKNWIFTILTAIIGGAKLALGIAACCYSLGFFSLIAKDLIIDGIMDIGNSISLLLS